MANIEVMNNFVKLIFYGSKGDIFKLAKKSNIEIDLSELNNRQIEFLEKITAEKFRQHFSATTTPDRLG